MTWEANLMTLALAQSHHMPPPQPARVPTPILLYVLCVKPCLSTPKTVKRERVMWRKIVWYLHLRGLEVGYLFCRQH